MTQKVRLLGSQTYNRIAAGEVVQRPASVVKELVENSIDAGATGITVEIRDAGKKLIRVTDDGEGMSSADVRLAFLKHATSKVSGPEDLDAIMTLGFRGEALSSIAAVSKIEMTSRPDPVKYPISDTGELDGTRCVVLDGKLISTESWGGATGTTIKVSDLFYNTPARLKFMKNSATEISHMLLIVQEYTVAFPGIRFRFIIDGKETFITPGKGSRIEAIAAVWGVNAARDLIKVDGVSTTCSLRGYVSAPGIFLKDRRKQIILVNSRPVRSREIREAVYDALRTSTMVHTHPIIALDLVTDPSQVDVNVHPAKTEVRFRNIKTVREEVREMITGAVSSSSTTLSLEDGHGTVTSPEVQVHLTPTPISNPPAPIRGTYEKRPPTNTVRSNHATPVRKVPVQSTLLSRGPVPPPHPGMLGIGNRHGLPPMKPLGQIALTYILCASPSGLVVIDQHALAERIELEALQERLTDARKGGQELLEPVLVSLNDAQIATLEELGDLLERMGFIIEPFGSCEVIVRQVPSSLGLMLDRDDLASMIEEFIESARIPDLGDRRLRMVQTMACHSALRAGQALDEHGMRRLVARMYELDNPFVCAHGRPTHLVMTTQELEKRFKRVV